MKNFNLNPVQQNNSNKIIQPSLNNNFPQPKDNYSQKQNIQNQPLNNLNNQNNQNRKNDFVYSGMNNYNTNNKNNGTDVLQNILRNEVKIKDYTENTFKKTLRNNQQHISPNKQMKNSSSNNKLVQQSKLDHIMSSYNNNSLINQLRPNYKVDMNKNNNITNNITNSAHSNYSDENHTQENYNEEVGKADKYFYLNTTSSIKDYCYFEDQNSRYRQYMEDFSKIIDKFSGDKSKGLFTMFDGHGGMEVSKYCKDRYAELFKSFYELHPTNIEKAINLSFLKLDEEIKFLDSENKGSTACCLFITGDLNYKKRIIYSANLGDTRCVLIQNNGFKRLSEDHRCSDIKEVQRVKNAGGVVFDGRVYGQLMITRAFGDYGLKTYGVTSVPYINKHIINEENDKYIIIATDGVWDVVEDEQAYKISKTIRNTEDFCKTLVNYAIQNGTKDNISCIVMKLN